MKVQITVDEIQELQRQHQKELELAYEQGQHSMKVPTYHEQLLNLFDRFTEVRGAGGKIQAIKKLRELTGLGLKEAKYAIEAIYRQEHWNAK